MAALSESQTFVSVEDAVLEVIGQYEYATESRVHNTLYLADLEKIKSSPDHLTRITDTEFVRYLEGVYSRDVHSSLEELTELGQIDTRPMIINRDKTTVYHDGMTDTEFPASDREILRNVTDEYANRSVDDLIDNVKRSWPFMRTKFKESIDFEEYYKRLHRA